MIFIDYGSYYPAHNIYYITGNSISQLEQLAAVLMSKFVKKQIEGISNRMNGGFPRWQSQSIKRLRIPRIATIPTKLSFKLISAYHNRNIEEIDSIVNDIIRIQIESTTPGCRRDIQKSLFDYDFSENIVAPGFGIQ